MLRTVCSPTYTTTCVNPMRHTNLLSASEPAGDAALGLGGALLNLAVHGVDLLHRLAAGFLAILLELVLGIGNFLPGLLSLQGGG